MNSNTIVEEGWFSGDAEAGESASGSLLFYAFNDLGGEQGRRDAGLAVLQTAPITYRGMPRRGIGTDKFLTKANLGGTDYWVYEIPVKYSLELNQATPSDPTGVVSGLPQFASSLSWNVIGGTSHITTALATTSYVASGGTVVDIKKTIGLDLKSGQVRGLDVISPVLDFTLTAQFPAALITPQFISGLYRMTPSTNNAAFKGYAAGELLFKGARGGNAGQDYVEINYEFAASPNETNVIVGSGSNQITVASKKGWEYLEVLYKDGTDTIAGRVIQVPAQVNVHRVFSEKDFSKLNIGVT